MKISKKRLKQIIKEEAADCVKDYMRMGYSRAQAYEECDDYPERGYGYRSSRPSYRRKTSYVGADANADQIAAVEAALEVKPNNFLQSVLGQLEAGRGLSSKQKSIVAKILKKTDPDAASLFEGRKHYVNEAPFDADGELGAEQEKAAIEIERILNGLWDMGLSNGELISFLQAIINDIQNGFVGKPR